jgi:hypothetical protein
MVSIQAPHVVGADACSQHRDELVRSKDAAGETAASGGECDTGREWVSSRVEPAIRTVITGFASRNSGFAS